MIIPIDRISKEALQGLVEDFITREGTDYGLEEVDLTTKVDQIQQQLRAGTVVVAFDPALESATLMTREQYQQWGLD